MAILDIALVFIVLQRDIRRHNPGGCRLRARPRRSAAPIRAAEAPARSARTACVRKLARPAGRGTGAGTVAGIRLCRHARGLHHVLHLRTRHHHTDSNWRRDTGTLECAAPSRGRAWGCLCRVGPVRMARSGSSLAGDCRTAPDSDVSLVDTPADCRCSSCS